MDQVLLKDFFEEEDAHWWHAAKRRLIRQYLTKAHRRILVLGVGGGRLCAELSQEHEVTAVDVSSVACKHARQVYGIKAIEHDLEQGLPFGGEQFDAIVIADVLEHIRHDKDLIAQMHRCLAKGGVLLVTVPAYAHMWSSWDLRLQHFRRYEFKQIKDLITNGHFNITKISFFNALIYPAALLRRKILRVKESSPSDFKISQGGTLFSALMGVYYRAERAGVRMGVVPFGLSLFVCAEKS